VFINHIPINHSVILLLLLLLLLLQLLLVYYYYYYYLLLVVVLGQCIGTWDGSVYSFNARTHMGPGVNHWGGLYNTHFQLPKLWKSILKFPLWEWNTLSVVMVDDIHGQCGPCSVSQWKDVITLVQDESNIFTHLINNSKIITNLWACQRIPQITNVAFSVQVGQSSHIYLWNTL